MSNTSTYMSNASMYVANKAKSLRAQRTPQPQTPANVYKGFTVDEIVNFLEIIDRLRRPNKAFWNEAVKIWQVKYGQEELPKDLARVYNGIHPNYRSSAKFKTATENGEATWAPGPGPSYGESIAKKLWEAQFKIGLLKAFATPETVKKREDRILSSYAYGKVYEANEGPRYKELAKRHKKLKDKGIDIWKLEMEIEQYADQLVPDEPPTVEDIHMDRDELEDDGDDAYNNREAHT